MRLRSFESNYAADGARWGIDMVTRLGACPSRAADASSALPGPREPSGVHLAAEPPAVHQAFRETHTGGGRTGRPPQIELGNH